jgi:dihydroorotase
VVPHTARQFGRAIIMPNLKPPVTTTAQALAYRERILAALPAGQRLRAADDPVPHRQHPAGGDRRAKASGLVHA